MADLLVRGVDDGRVQALKKRAGAHGRSAEAEHRAILAAALMTPPRRNLAELLGSMPDGGLDTDFERQDDGAATANVFDWHQCDQRSPQGRAGGSRCDRLLG